MAIPAPYRAAPPIGDPSVMVVTDATWWSGIFYVDSTFGPPLWIQAAFTDDGGTPYGDFLAPHPYESGDPSLYVRTLTDGYTFQIGCPVYTPRTLMRFAVRYANLYEWSPYTDIAVGRFYMVWPVGPPIQLYMDRGPDRPLIAGSLNVGDPADYITGVEIEVYKQTSQGNVAMMLTGMQPVAGTSRRSETYYDGGGLQPGNVIYWHMRHRDRDGTVGDWSAWTWQTVMAETGPDAMSPLSPSTKLLTRTPVLTIANSVAFDQYTWALYRDGARIGGSEPSGTPIAITSTSSVQVTVPADLLSWGDGATVPLEWDAGIHRTGSSDTGVTMSPRRGLRVNGLPATTLSASTYRLGYIETADPTYSSPYTDADRATYGEAPVCKEWEIRQASSPPGTGSLVKHIADLTPTESEQLGAAFVPTVDVAYDLRVRYRDDATAKVSTTLAASSSAGATNVKVTAITSLAAGDWLTLEPGTADEETRLITVVGTAGAGGSGITVDHGFTLAHASSDAVKVFPWGPWTLWLTETYHPPPVVAASLPGDGSVVNDPTRTLTWTFTSSRAQTQAAVRLYKVVGSSDDLIHEATQAGTGLSYLLPPYLLETGSTYAWTVEGTDALGFTGTSARRTFTTSFSAPAQLTGLTATPIPGRSKVALAWTASADAYLDAYIVEWQQLDGTWIRIDGGPTTSTDTAAKLTATSFSHYGARLGVNDYRVSAHNGSQQGTVATVSVTLAAPRSGAWGLVQYRDDADTEMTTTLAADSAISATTVKLTSVTDIAVGDWLTIEPGTLDEETRQVVTVGTAGSGGTGVLLYGALTLAHASTNVVHVHAAAAAVIALDPLSAPRVLNTQPEVYRPPGRGSAVVLSWPASGRSADISATYIPAEGAMAREVETLYASQARCWLKAPSGYGLDPLHVIPTGLSDEPHGGGLIGVAIHLEEVEA